MYNVKVKLRNLKTLLKPDSAWKNNSSPLINNKIVSLFYLRAKGLFPFKLIHQTEELCVEPTSEDSEKPNEKITNEKIIMAALKRN